MALASSDFPSPGGPISRRLWPPAAANSAASLAASCYDYLTGMGVVEV